MKKSQVNVRLRGFVFKCVFESFEKINIESIDKENNRTRRNFLELTNAAQDKLKSEALQIAENYFNLSHFNSPIWAS